jgi:hypothetical protein
MYNLKNSFATLDGVDANVFQNKTNGMIKQKPWFDAFCLKQIQDNSVNLMVAESPSEN